MQAYRKMHVIETQVILYKLIYIYIIQVVFLQSRTPWNGRCRVWGLYNPKNFSSFTNPQNISFFSDYISNYVGLWTVIIILVVLMGLNDTTQNRVGVSVIAKEMEPQSCDDQWDQN